MPLIQRIALPVIDNRTTRVCLHVAGQIVDTDEEFETLAGDFMDPPFHIHCRTMVGPWMPGMINQVRKDSNDELMRRPKKFRRIGPDGEIGARIPPPSRENLPSGYRFPGTEEAAWKPKRAQPVVVPEPLTEQAAADWFNTDPYTTTEDERRSVGLYVGGGRMNDQLRAGRTDEFTQEHIDTIDAVIGKQEPLPAPITVYRGVSSAFLPDLAPGVQVMDPAYLSTALGLSTASNFAGGGLLLEITVPAGMKVLPVNHAFARDQSDVPEQYREIIDVLSGESEILLPHGTALQIVSVERRTVDGRSMTWVKAVVVDG